MLFGVWCVRARQSLLRPQGPLLPLLPLLLLARPLPLVLLLLLLAVLLLLLVVPLLLLLRWRVVAPQEVVATLVEVPPESRPQLARSPKCRVAACRGVWTWFLSAPQGAPLMHGTLFD